MTTRTDLEGLKDYFELPAAATGAHWRVATLGDPGGMLPGGSDQTVRAFVSIDPDRWDEVDAVFGTLREGRGTFRTDPGNSLIPEEVWADWPRDAEGLAVTEDFQVYIRRDFARSPFRLTHARRLGDHGVYISAMTQ